MPISIREKNLILTISIPAQLRSFPFDPENSTSLQLIALNSWRKVGFIPVSLHTPTELAEQTFHAAKLAQAGVGVMEVHQTNLELLPNLRKSLEALVVAHPKALLAITNADIVFASGNLLPQAIQSLGPDQALIGRRTNVAADADVGSVSSGNRDVYGFDFFALHASSLRRALPLIPEGLVFGRPWWDLFLPLALLAAGLKLRDPGPDLFLHPFHEERWSAEQWFRFGLQADQRFLQLLSEQGCQTFAQRWRRQRRRAVRNWSGFTVLRHRFREQCRSLLSQGKLLPVYLSDVSDAINSLIDQELQN